MSPFLEKKLVDYFLSYAPRKNSDFTPKSTLKHYIATLFDPFSKNVNNYWHVWLEQTLKWGVLKSAKTD